MLYRFFLTERWKWILFFTLFVLELIIIAFQKEIPDVGYRNILYRTVRFYLGCFTLGLGIVFVIPKEKFNTFNLFLASNSKKIIWITFASYLIVFLIIVILRHVSYGSHFLDLAALDQPIYNTTKGDFMMMTMEDGINRPRFAGGSVELILAPISLIYYLFPTPITLLVIQTFAIAISILGIGKIWRFLAPHDGFSLLAIMLFFMSYTPLHFVNIFDFHAYGLLIPGAIFLIYFLIKNHWQGYFLSLAYLCLIRNDLALYSIPLFLYLLYKRKWIPASIGIVACLGFYAFIVSYFSPLFGDVPMRFEKYVHHRHLGSSAIEIFLNIALHPINTLQMIFSSPEKVQNLLRLLWITGIFPLLAGLDILFLATPFFLLYFLPASPIFTEPYHQYNASMIPFIIIATLIGLVRLNKFMESKYEKSSHRWYFHPYIISVTVIIAILLGNSIYNLNVNNAYRHFKDDILIRYINNYEHYKKVDEFVEYVNNNIPKDANLAVNSALGPHVSQRDSIFLIPRQLEGIEYIFTDHIPYISKMMPVSEFNRRIMNILKKGEYKVIKYDDGILLMQKVNVVTQEIRTNNLIVAEKLQIYNESF